MDRNLLVNYERVFVLIRSNIKNKYNSILLNCIKFSLINDFSNEEFIDLLKAKSKTKHKLFVKRNDITSSLILINSNENICNYNELKDLLIYAADKIIDLLDLNKYDEAYDLVDFIHAIPSIFYLDNTCGLNNYWNVNAVKLQQKWGKPYFQEFKDFFTSESRKLQ